MPGLPSSETNILSNEVNQPRKRIPSFNVQTNTALRLAPGGVFVCAQGAHRRIRARQNAATATKANGAHRRIRARQNAATATKANVK